MKKRFKESIGNFHRYVKFRSYHSRLGSYTIFLTLD